MPRKAATQAADLMIDLAALIEEAQRFCPMPKGEALMRKWLADMETEDCSEFRQMCILADAGLLAREVLLSQPSASGATAFDRLARTPVQRTDRETSALTALRASRFALLLVGEDLPGGETASRDSISGETFRLACDNLPRGLAGTSVFGRLVALGGGLSVIAGVPTPLDSAALALATSHPAARLRGAGAGTRWAEAVYSHVVRHGTLDIPGMNRPQDMESFMDAADDGPLRPEDVEEEELVILARAWAALDGGPPDQDLLRRSRELCDPNAVISALVGVVMTPRSEHHKMAAGLERLLLVQIETVLRREQIGSSTVTLDRIAAQLEGFVREHGLPAEVRETWRIYRQRVAGRLAQGRVEDADLTRLLQRIRGLRAKTVDTGCTEQEALAAAEKVAELLDRYGLSLGELDFQAQLCEGGAVQTTRRRAAPLDSCVPTIAEFFDCRVWAEQPGGGALRYMFFGLRADIAASLYLYELVERAFATETDAFRAGPVYAGMAGERRTATGSFQTGLALGIRGKLAAIRAARAQRQSSGRDLVVMKAAIVDDELAKLGLLLHLKTTGSAAKQVLKDAFVAGTAAAERFEWTPGIGEAA